ncbi:MAG: hypothetical protein CMJ64_27190 [Planctomycetaceae bacterium]|nr:hypothetical protein [Planctomycetaceae bacterium]
MIHYSCDRCKHVIDPAEDMRYVVKMEVQAAMEPLEGEEPESDRDHLLEIQEILKRMEDSDSDLLSDDVYSKRRYDLCSECYHQFMRNPLSREVPAHLGFSQN